MIVKNTNPILLDTLAMTHSVICIYNFRTGPTTTPQFITIPASDFLVIYENWIALDNRNFIYHLDDYGPILKLEVAKIEPNGNIFVYNEYMHISMPESGPVANTVEAMKNEEFSRLIFLELHNKQHAYASSHHFIPQSMMDPNDVENLDRMCPIYEHSQPIADPSIERMNQLLSINGNSQLLPDYSQINQPINYEDDDVIDRIIAQTQPPDQYIPPNAIEPIYNQSKKKKRIVKYKTDENNERSKMMNPPNIDNPVMNQPKFTTFELSPVHTYTGPTANVTSPGYEPPIPGEGGIINHNGIITDLKKKNDYAPNISEFIQRIVSRDGESQSIYQDEMKNKLLSFILNADKNDDID